MGDKSRRGGERRFGREKKEKIWERGEGQKKGEKSVSRKGRMGEKMDRECKQADWTKHTVY